jgi:hypothetical protein
MTRPEFDKLLSLHQQLFPMSCAASGMEIILKFHKKVDFDWFDFQREFQNTNIGWNQVGRLQQFGVQATDSRCDLDTFYTTLESQSAQDRIFAFSLPTSAIRDLIFDKWTTVANFHIFVAAKIDGETLLVSKRFLSSQIVQIRDLKETYNLIRQIDRDYTIDILTYDLL